MARVTVYFFKMDRQEGMVQIQPNRMATRETILKNDGEIAVGTQVLVVEESDLDESGFYVPYQLGKEELFRPILPGEEQRDWPSTPQP